MQCMLQMMIVLEFLHKGDLRGFLLNMTPEYVVHKSSYANMQYTAVHNTYYGACMHSWSRAHYISPCSIVGVLMLNHTLLVIMSCIRTYSSRLYDALHVHLHAACLAGSYT